MADRSEVFKLKDNALTGNAEALQEYRETQTNGNHQFGRSYLGAQ